MPRYKSDDTSKSEVSDLQMTKSSDLLIFKLWIQNFFLAIKSIEARGLIPIAVILELEVFFALPPSC